MSTNLSPQRKHEQGIVVAGFALVMIVVLAVAAIASISSALLSQRIATNDIRISQALEAAEAGLNLAIASLRSRTPPYAPIIRTLPNGASFVATVTEINEYQKTHFTIVSRGSSTDGSASRTVRQTAALLRLLQTTPKMPLIVRRSLILEGDSRIINSEGFTTIWSGNVTGFGERSSGGTYISSRGDGALLKSTSAKRIGADVVLNDPALTHLTDDEFYYFFIGIPRYQLQELSVTRSNVVWLKDPSGTVRIADNAVLGSSENPVLIYIDGNINITGNPIINGLLYVRGDFINSGGADITGAVVIEGSINNTRVYKLAGNLRLTYDRALLSRLNSGAPFVRGLAGTWKDF